MKSLFTVLKNIFAAIGVVISVVFIIFGISTPSGTDWRWSEERKIIHDTSYIAIERGVHDHAVDKVRVILVSSDQRRELWSSYMKTKPEVSWTSSNVISIRYIKEESHSYWPQVGIDDDVYYVNLSYKN